MNGFDRESLRRQQAKDAQARAPKSGAEAPFSGAREVSSDLDFDAHGNPVKIRIGDAHVSVAEDQAIVVDSRRYQLTRAQGRWWLLPIGGV